MKSPSDEHNFIAVDLGASGGRVLLARLAHQKLTLQDVHRFEHRPAMIDGLLSWDIDHIWKQIKHGLASVAGMGVPISSIAIDSWAVDYGLIDSSGELLRQPVAYRDPRNVPSFERVTQMLGRETIYARTGIQFMPINTIYQLAADAQDGILDRADCMLMIPQLIGYWLTGRKVAEHTNASSTQCYDSDTGRWITDFTNALQIPSRILPPVVDSTEILGTLLPVVARELNLPESTPVIAGASHDTGAAVVGAPLVFDPEAQTRRAASQSAYLSSGTWSLVGVELDHPIRTEAALKENLTNEAGIFGTTRLLKNVTGMWLVQECRRHWSELGENYSYEQLTQWASDSPASTKRIDPNDPIYASPGDMPARIRANSSATTPAQIVRCIYDSLAHSYAKVLKQIESVTGETIQTLHIVGGGSQNEFLNQLTANATGCTVIAGPVEATAIGNALVQAIAVGAIKDLPEARDMVRRSFGLVTFVPRATSPC